MGRSRSGTVRLRWATVREPEVLVAVGLVLAYVWRWHDLSPVLSPLRISALLTVSCWALLALNLPRLRVVFRYPYAKLFVLWFLWMLVGGFYSIDPDFALDFVLGSQGKAVTAFLFLIVFVRTAARVHWIALAHVCGAAVLAFYYAKQGFPGDWSPVPMYDSNDLALVLAMAAPLGVFLATEFQVQWQRRVMWGVTALICSTAILSQSRGGFLAVIAMMLFLFVQHDGLRWRTRILIPTVFVMGVALAPAEVKDEFMTLTRLEEDYNLESTTGRKAIWSRGTGYLRDQPVFGVGAASFGIADARLAPQASYDDRWRGKAAHNSYLQVAVETGVVGLVLYLGVLVSVSWRLFRLRRVLRRVPDRQVQSTANLCTLLLASLVAYLVGSIFLSQGYMAMLFFLVALAASVEATVAPAISPVRSRLQRHGRPQLRRGPARLHHPTAVNPNSLSTSHEGRIATK